MTPDFFHSIQGRDVIAEVLDESTNEDTPSIASEKLLLRQAIQFKRISKGLGTLEVSLQAKKHNEQVRPLGFIMRFIILLPCDCRRHEKTAQITR